ncbi:hypothetical protein ACHAXN_010353 [Cyclotella atomus]
MKLWMSSEGAQQQETAGDDGGDNQAEQSVGDEQQQQQSSPSEINEAASSSASAPVAAPTPALFPPLGSASEFCSQNGLIDGGPAPSSSLATGAAPFTSSTGGIDYPAMRFGAGSSNNNNESSSLTSSSFVGASSAGRGSKKTKYNSQKRTRSGSGKTQEIHVYPPNTTATSSTVAPASTEGLFGASTAGTSTSSSSTPIFKFNTPSKNNVPTTAAAALSFGKDFEPNNSDDGDNNTTSANNTNDHMTTPNHNDNSDNTSDPDGTNNNNIQWQPQQTTSTCEFTHTITSYSQKRDSGCKKAEYSDTTIDSLGNKWRLIIYVNGNGRASNHHLSLFLQVADAEELPFGWNKAVSYVLTLEHPNGGDNVSINSGGVTSNSNTNSNNNGDSSSKDGSNSGYAKRNPDKTFKMCPKAIDWGWSQFIASDRILREGYVDSTTDTLTVRASVTVKSSGVEIDPEDAELYLKCAVEEGNVEGVKACLARDASVNCQFKDDLYTPLHTACSVNNVNGDGSNNASSSSASSSSNNNNHGNSSPGPIPEGSMDVLKLLLEEGADVNACNKWRETPLLIAANNGHADAVRALLRSGADPGLCSEAGWSALTFAAHKGYDEIVQALLDADAPVNCRVTEDLSTPLHKACAGSKPGHLSAVHMLLEGDADVHALNKWRETPLLTAANHGQCEAVEALLDYGADPCKCTDTGWSPLSIAAYKGHDDVVRLLLEEGAPTEEDDPTLSALLQAATKGLPDTVMLLLEHGADHTVTTKKGDTALAILVEQNLIDAAVEMVTDYNASIPRCSRDRKKVQRARLLINLRLKQMQRDGTGPYCDDTDEEDEGESSDGDEFENSSAPLHHDNNDHDDLPIAEVDGGTSKKKKGKKKNKGAVYDRQSIAKAEAEARAAEEALLLELEAEEKERNALSEAKSAKKKKQKQKEKERMLREAEKAKEEEAALAAIKAKEQQEKSRQKQQLKQQASSTPTSPAKKEVVVEITSNTIDKSAAEPTKAIEKSQKKKDAQNNANAKEPAKAKSKEVALPKPSASGYSVIKAEKKAPPLKTSAAATKKIPGDNPISTTQPRRIPGNNPVVKKIPGDNPKIPVQQSRTNVQPISTVITSTQPKLLSPTKSKRGWENKTGKATEPTAGNHPKARQPKSQPSAPMAVLPKDSKKTNAPKGKAAKGADRDSMTSPTNRNKVKSDDGTQSTANSTAMDSLPPTPTNDHAFPSKVAVTPKQSRQAENSLDDQLANMANDVLGFLDFDSQQQESSQEHNYFSARQTITPPMPAPAPAPSMSNAPSSTTQQSMPFAPLISIELPAISSYRLEKVNEIFRRCAEAKSSPDNPLRVIDEHTLRVVLYRWIIRASHGADAFIDPIIPSWEDEEFLKAFLQRQFISEGRRSPTNMNVLSIEVLRDAGTAMSELCLSLAREVSQFQLACAQQVAPHWSDADINVSGMQDGSSVIIDWAGKSRLSIPFSLFNSMARRYVGEQNRLMAAVFAAARRHEIIAAIVDQTNMISHLPSQTVDSISKGLGANLQTLSDSISVNDNNSFCTMFPDVDAVFGGLLPFAKEKGGGESVLMRSGGSVIVVAPPENATASQCIRKVIDLVESSPNNPLSFSVILSSDCFVNAAPTLSVDDLRPLDPRLCGEQNSFITYVEEIPAGVGTMTKCSSMFMLIQNELGRRHAPPHPNILKSIRSMMRSDVRVLPDVPVSPSYSALPAGLEQSNFSPMPQHSYSVQENPFAANPFAAPAGVAGAGSRARGHRGRLFDLVGEEDADDEGMNILPMLDGLNMDEMMFGNSNANEDIDIEAISLMGIGLNGACLNRYGGNQS